MLIDEESLVLVGQSSIEFLKQSVKMS